MGRVELGRRMRLAVPPAVALVSFAVNTTAHQARADIHHAWARAAAEAICAGVVLRLLLSPPRKIDEWPGTLRWLSRWACRRAPAGRPVSPRRGRHR